MKRKTSVALVFVVVAILLSGAAFALSQWNRQMEKVAAIEAEKGYFEDWAASDRIELVRILRDGGELAEDEQVKTLLSGTLNEAESAELASQIIVRWLGLREDAVSLRSILEKLWGEYPVTWAQEDLVWYSQLLEKMNWLGKDHERFILPGDGSFPREDAIRAAREAVEQAYGVPSGTLEDYGAAAQFGIWDGTEGNARPQWCVTFLAAEDTQNPGLHKAWAFVDGETGQIDQRLLSAEAEVWKDMAAKKEDPLILSIRAFEEKAGGHIVTFGKWSLADKAEWSQQMRDSILAREAEQPGFLDPMTVASAQFVYGLPAAEDMAQDAALNTARTAIAAAYGLKEDTLSFYNDVDVYFDVTDPDNPLWKFYFNYMDESYDALRALYSEGRIPRYKVELHARTGEVVQALEVGMLESRDDLRRF